MSSPRLRKLLGDLRVSSGRVASMMIAIAVAVTGFGAILIAKEGIATSASAAYVGTDPAAATLDLPGGVDPSLIEEVRGRDGVADATALGIVTMRVDVDGSWLPLRIFVRSADDPLRIARFDVESGTWPPGGTGLALERGAVDLLGADVGDSLTVVDAQGAVVSVPVTGRVWDAALAPAVQERTGYAFATPEAVAALGFEPSSDQLAITVADDVDPAIESRDPARVDAVATSLATWLEAEGHPVHSVTAPPYRHPHQNQTDAATGLLLGFGIATLLLAAVLVASTLGGMLAAQSRQIGAMKAVGATGGMIARLYFVATFVIATVATAIGIVPAYLLGVAVARLVGGILNLTTAPAAPSAVTVVLIVAAGLLIPPLVGIAPVWRAARVTVREAIADVGSPTPNRRWAGVLSRTRYGDRIPVLAARNVLRRPRRLIATVLLLATGGMLFIAALDASGSWQRWVDDGLDRRHYDAELTLADPQPTDDVATALASVSAVTSWEGVVSLPATPLRPDGTVMVERVYPDGGHGAFSATAIDPATRLVEFAVREGRALVPGDAGVVVLNQAAVTRLGEPAVGDRVAVATDGSRVFAGVVGIVDEVGAVAAAYLPTGALDAAVGGPDRVTTVRIVSSDAGAETARAALEAAGMSVAAVLPTTELRTAIDQHIIIFIAVLVVLAILMAIIGTIGLASAMTVSVLERTREFGIMSAIGARRRVIVHLVLSEALMIGLAGLALAAVLGPLLGLVVGGVVGRLSFGVPLPFVLSVPALVIWGGIAIVGSIVAASGAASRSARLTVRESLAHV
jgi:putative ABC transport system permease protein